MWKLAQINNKAVRSLSKLMEAGFDSEKAVLNMTMDDILSLPGITVAEIGMINEIQKAVKAGKFITTFFSLFRCGLFPEVKLCTQNTSAHSTWKLINYKYKKYPAIALRNYRIFFEIRQRASRAA